MWGTEQHGFHNFSGILCNVKISLSLHSCNNHLCLVLKVFNASEELALASKFPQVRIFMAALEQSYTELTDLAGVEVPWSVPTASMDRLHTVY